MSHPNVDSLAAPPVCDKPNAPEAGTQIVSSNPRSVYTNFGLATVPLPVGAPMALTPAVAVSLGLPTSNIPPDMKVEVVTLFVVRIPMDQKGKAAFAYDVVTSDTVPLLAEAVATYSNQCLLWRSMDDGSSSNLGRACPERNGALLNLKSRIWQDFLVSSAYRDPQGSSASAAAVNTPAHPIGDISAPHLPPSAASVPVVPNMVSDVAPTQPRPIQIPPPPSAAGPKLGVLNLPQVVAPSAQAMARGHGLGPPVSSTAAANRIRHPWPTVEVNFEPVELPPTNIPNGSAPPLILPGSPNLRGLPFSPQVHISGRDHPSTVSRLGGVAERVVAVPVPSGKPIPPLPPPPIASSSRILVPEVQRGIEMPVQPSGPSKKRSANSVVGGVVGAEPEGMSVAPVSAIKKRRFDIGQDGFPQTLDQGVRLYGSAPLSWEMTSSSHSPTKTDYRNLTCRLIDEAKRNAEADKKAALESSLTVPVVSLEKGGSHDIAMESSTGSHATEEATSSSSSLGTRSGGRRQTQQQRAASSAKEKDKEPAEEWVQCDSCSRWRLLPTPSHPQYPGELPDTWNCTMNTWNPSQASCSVPEDTSNSSKLSVQRAIKLRVWVRRLRSADRFESKMYRSSTDRDSRPYGEVDWVRCSNPACGKWRACARYMDGKALRKKYPVWFCWMNSWDEARSSCGAPQEGSAVHSLAEKGAGEVDGDDDESWGNPDEDEEDGGTSDGNGLTLQGISSRGRIVRSRWNSSRRNRR